MQPNTSPWGALPVLLAGAFMVVLDFFIVNVALPSIATELGAGDTSLEWVVAGYGLTFAAFLITAGRLGDALGRRRVYVIGLALFTATSAACGLAPSPTTLVLARLISPGRRSSSKSQNYETGEVTVTDPWRPFPVRYYVFALLFLVFDVEAAFLFPWAVIYRSLGVYGFVEMVIFVSILAVGLVYAWKKGALKWV